MKYARAILAVVFIALIVVGCASTPPLVITGEGLSAVGVEFVATATAVTNACVAKKLTVAQCDGFRTFEQKFKAAFGPAVVVQKTAMTFGDKTMAENAATILGGLISELGSFSALIGK